MRKRLLLGALAILIAALPAIPSLAQIPDGYYNSLKGKKGAELKTAIYHLIKDAKVLNYGSGRGNTWWGFWDTDRDERGYFIDRYSAENEWEKSTSQGAAGAGMNIEHSFPKSWWGGASCQAYKDLYNLMPCKSKINSTKSNYPMGTVVSGDKGNGWTKVGKGDDGKLYWEPASPWKGDFARGYMYMATTYQNYNWTGTQALQILQQGTYPTLKPWAYKLFIQWAKGDKPDALEIKRNEDVYKIQGNRNPYVDFPNLMEYVWGDSIDYAFNPETTLKSTDYKGGDGGSGGGGSDGSVTPSPDVPENPTLYSADFTKEKGGCTEKIVKNESSNAHIWVQDSKFGWKASAFSGGKKHAADAYLYLPEIDLTDYSHATLTVNQAINFADKQALKYLSVEATVNDPEVSEDIVSKLPDLVVPSKDSWTFANYNLDLSQYCGGKVKLAFHYTSDTQIAPYWEIKNLNITGIKASTGISTPVISTDNRGEIDFSLPYQIFTIDGRKITSTAGMKGVVIIRQGKESLKVKKDF